MKMTNSEDKQFFASIGQSYLGKVNLLFALFSLYNKIVLVSKQIIKYLKFYVK